MRTKHSMRESPPTSLVINYLRNHNTYPILVLLFASRRRRSSQCTHTVTRLLIMMISVVVVYEQGVGLKSSITVGTASRKDFNPAGVYQLPITRLRTHAHLSQLLPIKGNHFMT